MDIADVLVIFDSVLFFFKKPLGTPLRRVAIGPSPGKEDFSSLDPILSDYLPVMFLELGEHLVELLVGHQCLRIKSLQQFYPFCDCYRGLGSANNS